MKTQELHSIDDLFFEALKAALWADHLGSRVGGSREMLGVGFTLPRPWENVLQHPRRKLSYPYAIAETLWYWAREDSIDRLLPYAPSYTKFADEDGIAHGAYGARIENNDKSSCRRGFNDQLENVVHLLQNEPETRRAVVTIFDATRDNERLHASAKEPDVPCTLSWQFLVRRGRLNMVVTMRSEDIWLGLPYDIFAFTTIQMVVANELNLQCGAYHHQVGSFHLYDKNRAAAEECWERPTGETFLPPAHGLNFEHMDLLCDLEAELRDYRITDPEELYTDKRFDCLPPYGQQLAAVLAAHWFPISNSNFPECMKKGMERYVDSRRS